MEQEPRRAGRVAIERVARDRAAEPQWMRRVSPQLVGPPGPRMELDPRSSITPPDHPPVGDADLAVHRIVDLVRPTIDVESERELDRPRVSANVADQLGFVTFLDRPRVELPA